MINVFIELVILRYLTSSQFKAYSYSTGCGTVNIKTLNFELLTYKLAYFQTRCKRRFYRTAINTIIQAFTGKIQGILNRFLQ